MTLRLRSVRADVERSGVLSSVEGSRHELFIEVHINNDTALSVELLDDVRKSTPYSKFSLSPCVINYQNVYRMPNPE